MKNFIFILLRAFVRLSFHTLSKVNSKGQKSCMLVASRSYLAVVLHNQYISIFNAATFIEEEQKVA